MNNLEFDIALPPVYSFEHLNIWDIYISTIADILARYENLRGFKVSLFTGTNNMHHAESADNHDPMSELSDSKDTLWKALGLSYRQSELLPRDKQLQRIERAFDYLLLKGDIYRTSITGWYCERDDLLWKKKELIDGLCPECHNCV